MENERLANLRRRIEKRRLGIPDLETYDPSPDKKVDDEVVPLINDSRGRRGIIRRFSRWLELTDPLGGAIVDPAYFTSKWNVKRALRVEESRIPATSIARWLREKRDIERPWRSDTPDLEKLLEIMSEGTHEVPLSLIAFEFGFDAFVHFFSQSSDATIWNCSYGGWMMKRRMLNTVAREYDDWDEDDICGISIYKPTGKYRDAVGDPVVDWITAFADLHEVFLDGDCPLATRELLYLIFRGQDIRREDSHGVMNLEDCISLWFDLFLARDYLVKDEKEEYTGVRSRFDPSDLEQCVMDIAAELLFAYVNWFPDERVVLDLNRYISAQIRDGYIDPSPAFDDALDRAEMVNVLLLDDWTIPELTRALMTRYGLKSKHLTYRRILDDDSSFIEGD